MARVREISDRLAELQPGERTADQIATKLNGNVELVEDIIQHVTNHVESRSALVVYEWLYDCYKTRNDSIQLFILQCIPPVISNYLSATATMNTQLKSHTEPCLLEIYNQEAAECEVVPGKLSFSMPTLTRSSIYHHSKYSQGKSSSTPLLTESALHKHDHKSQRVSLPAPPRIDRVNASNRMAVIEVVLRCIQTHIIDMSVTAQVAFCHMCVRLASSGFPRWSPSLSMVSSVPQPRRSLSPLLDSEIQRIAAQRRLKLTPRSLQEIISSVYVCLYHEEKAAAKQALEAIRLRAQFDGTAQVLMTVNAVLHGLKCIDGNPSAGPLGFSLTASQVMTRKVSSITQQRKKAEQAETNESSRSGEEDKDGIKDEPAVPEIHVLAENGDQPREGDKQIRQETVINDTATDVSRPDVIEAVELSVISSQEVNEVSAGDVKVEIVNDEMNNGHSTTTTMPLWTEAETFV